MKTKKKYIPLYLMMIPGAVYLIINNYIPMAGLVVAFKKYTVQGGLFGSEWVGLENFKYLFSNDAGKIFFNTLMYNAVFIVVNLVVGVALAIMIYDVAGKKLKKLYQSSIMIPFLVSMVIVSYVVFGFLSADNGMINKVLESLGREGIVWYQEAKYWPFIIVLVNTWKTAGYGCLIYLAGLGGISTSYYEAAVLDGATKWQQIKHITVPCLVPSIVTLLLMNVGRIFYSDFSLFYQVTQNSGALFNVTNTIDTYVYRAMTTAGGIGRSSAAGAFQSVVGFIFVLGANLIVRRLSKENALF